MNTPKLPALNPGLLSPSNSSRAILDLLAQHHYQQQGPALAQARQVIEQWAGALAHNGAPQQEVELLEEARETPFSEILEAMDAAQAGRFIEELFSDIVPHFSSQKAFFTDLARGKTQGGMHIEMDVGSKLHYDLIANLPADMMAMLVDIQTKTQRLTWVDDNLRRAETHLTLDAHVSGAPVGNPRKLSF